MMTTGGATSSRDDVSFGAPEGDSLLISLAALFDITNDEVVYAGYGSEKVCLLPRRMCGLGKGGRDGAGAAACTFDV